jgi:hypothetical protein
MAEKIPAPAPPNRPAGLRLAEALRLQEIEGNPLSADQLAMFQMFEREAWTHEQRRAYIEAKAVALAAE